MWNLAFWKSAAERSIRTAAQVFGGFLVVGAAISDIDWGYAASVTAVATLASFVLSISVNTVTGTGPSVTAAEQTVAKDEIVIPIESVYAPAD